MLIPLIPVNQLKFCNEAHFISHALHQHHIISPCGVHTYLRDSAALGDSFSIMLLLNLSNPNNPFYINFQAKSNSEVNFLNFIKAAVLAGQLKYRDFFIVNNTSIHYSQGTWAELLLDAMNQLHPPNEKYKW